MALEDLALFQQNLNGTVVQALATPANNGYTVTGVIKLVQRFLLELLTEKGELVYLPERGTKFLPLLRNGAATSWEVNAAFAIALLDLEPNLLAEEEDSDLELDEQYQAAELKNIQVTPGMLTATIAIQNKAGFIYNVSLPLVFRLL